MRSEITTNYKEEKTLGTLIGIIISIVMVWSVLNHQFNSVKSELYMDEYRISSCKNIINHLENEKSYLNKVIVLTDINDDNLCVLTDQYNQINTSLLNSKYYYADMVNHYNGLVNQHKWIIDAFDYKVKEYDTIY